MKFLFLPIIFFVAKNRTNSKNVQLDAMCQNRYITVVTTIASDKNETLFSLYLNTAASLLNAMDVTADPCEDFFQFACGSWVKKHVIPEDRSSLTTFEVMADDLLVILKG